MRDIISGKPVVVIDDNGIDFKELKKLNISCEELMESLRNLDYFDMSEINYAIIERTGKITVIPKASSMPVTREDTKLKLPENDIFYCIVENGKVLKKNFKEMGLLYDAVMTDIIHKIGGSMTNIRDIAFCKLSEDGNVYLQKYGGQATDFQIKISPKHYMNTKDFQAPVLSEINNKVHKKGSSK